ncbi:MAG TPA: hypothetical protein VHS27_18630 [Gaiellales bacterium]|nr:hypothetical protein [Gaiellales bacterium]
MGDTSLVGVVVIGAAIVAVGVLVAVLTGAPLAGILVAVSGLFGLSQRLRA